MIEIPEWLYRVAIGAGSAMASALAAGGIMVAKMSTRVSVLETRMKKAEEADRAGQAEVKAGLAEIRAEIKSVTVAIAGAREEALRFFAADGDLQRLEDKLDQMRTDVLKAARPRSQRKSASSQAHS